MLLHGRLRPGELARGEMPNRPRAGDAAWRLWVGAQLVLSAALVGALAYALRMFLKLGAGVRLEPWQHSAISASLGLGVATFLVRTVVLWLRFLGSRPRR